MHMSFHVYVMPKAKVTGMLRQGAARCMLSDGTVRPLAAACPSRPICYVAYLSRNTRNSARAASP